ncbi:hypothetical protein ACFLU4_06380 [Chloroflexota bacterium]
MDKKWIRITAGILDIINAIDAVIYGGGFLTGLIYISIGAPNTEGHDSYFSLLILIILIATIPIGIFILMGGIFTLKGKRWWLSLTASIVALLPAVVFWGFWPFISGFKYYFILPILPVVVAIALTVLSKKQFA